MKKKEYIEHSALLKELDYSGSMSPYCKYLIEKFSSADVVPWSWLRSYADGKRCNYASDFVVEAKDAWENGTIDNT